MTRHRWIGMIAMMALAATSALAAQTTASATTQATPARPAVTFSEKDRQATTSWFDAHRSNPPAGLRAGDRLSPQLESQLKTGFVLSDALKGQIHPVPKDLLHLLAPPPGIYQYGIVGWHLVLIDESFRVFDVIHLERVR